ncbi:UNVERIFIED_CONTAM: hypothetical protein FKN15_057226 [Acipenser sinensis]
MDQATLSALSEELDSRREAKERRREESPARKSGIQMGEAIVTEQFCYVVGAETQAWRRRHNPDTLEAAVKLAEDFEDSLISAKTGLLIAPLPRSSQAPTPLPVSLLPTTGPRPPRPPMWL